MNMKKLLIALMIVAGAGTSLFAQKGKVTSAANYKESGKLDKALETIEMTVDPNNSKSEKTIGWPRTWEVRGEIFKAIYGSDNAAYKALSEEPLDEAYKSYMKALELDNNGRYKSSLKINLTFLIQDLTNAAVSAFETQNYVDATKYFEDVLAIEATELFKEETPVDTVIMYNVGITAANAKMYDKAINYFRECIKYDYNGGESFGQIISAYKEMGDTATSVEVMKEGFEKYPENQQILFELINYYIDTNNSQEAINYLDKAIAKESDNPTLYFAKGSALEKLGRGEEALEVYQKAIDVDPDFANAYYNIGVYYFNKGVNQLKAASEVPTNKPDLYEQEKAKADEEFKKAVPYMEKALEKNPTDEYTKEQLKNLYYRLNMMDKFKALDESMDK